MEVLFVLLLRGQAQGLPGGKWKANAIMARLSEAQTSCVLPTSFSFFLSSINLFLLAI